MLDDQGNAMLNVSSFVGRSGSSNVVQYAANLMILAGTITQEFLIQKTLPIKPIFNAFDNYVSGLAFDQGKVIPSGFNPKTNTSYYSAV